MHRIVSFLIGLGAGVSALIGASLLLYFAPHLLRTTGLLIGLMLFSAAAGAWVARDPAETSARRRWALLIFAYLAAGVYSAIWLTRPGLNGTALGSALAALFLLAQPFYGSGALLASVVQTSGALLAAVLGVGLGAALAGAALVPYLDPDVIFFSIATMLLIARLFHDSTAPKPIQLSMSMQGKVALVTGVGSAGQVGFAIARALLAAGAQVICVDRSGNSAALAHELGSGAVGLSGDLSNDGAAVTILDEVRARFGRLDALINTAGGLTVIKPLSQTTSEEWRAELQRNADTAFVMSRAALPLLRESAGCIVNFASPAGHRAVANLGAYSAAKSAVIALTRALAIEEKQYDVRVNAIAPGMIDTEQNRQHAENPDAVKWVSRDDIASIVLFLCSDAATAITGETISAVGSGIQ